MQHDRHAGTPKATRRAPAPTAGSARAARAAAPRARSAALARTGGAADETHPASALSSRARARRCVIASRALFTVDQRQNAIVFQLGEVVAVHQRARACTSRCPLLQNVRFFDTRILTIDDADAERFLTSEKKNVLVDSFVKWRIIDVRAVLHLGAAATRRARRRASRRRSTTALRAEFGKRTVHDVVSRASATRSWSIVRDKVDEDVKPHRRGGRRRAPEARRPRRRTSASRLSRGWKPSGKRVANELRSHRRRRGREDQRRRRPPAPGDRRRGLPDAQRVKGEGDARRRAIYAEAFQREPRVLRFYRSLEAYRAELSHQGATCWCSIRARSSSSTSGIPAAVDAAGRRAWADASSMAASALDVRDRGHRCRSSRRPPVARHVPAHPRSSATASSGSSG